MENNDLQANVILLDLLTNLYHLSVCLVVLPGGWHRQKNSFENQLSLPEKVVAFQCACLSNTFMNI